MGKRVKKLVLSIALMGALMVPGLIAFASELSNADVINDADSSTEIPKAVVSKLKENVVITYDTLEEVAESYYYTEFSGGLWWSGTLYLISTKKTSAGYMAFYSGTLFANT